MTRSMKEAPARTLPGLPMLLLTLALLIGGAVMTAVSARSAAVDGTFTDSTRAGLFVGIPLLLLGVFVPLGLFIVEPNKSVVVVLFGRYKGTQRRAGWYWTNPFTVGQRKEVSLRIRNFDTARLKVNDVRGNPIEIAAVVVWRVIDTAQAVFDVDDFTEYVAIQSETAIRHLASQYPYDSYGDEVASLTGNITEVSGALQAELDERLSHAGVEVVETRLSHLSYAPEIAQAMLRRQQATAIVAARQKMVEGAVGMVDMALRMIAEENLVQLDEERKASMISNLLVVLTSEQAATPVLNAGTLYQ